MRRSDRGTSSISGQIHPVFRLAQPSYNPNMEAGELDWSRSILNLIVPTGTQIVLRTDIFVTLLKRAIHGDRWRKSFARLRMAAIPTGPG